MIGGPRISRREWLAGSLLGGLSLTGHAAEPKVKTPDPAVADEIAVRSEALAKKAGLREFRTTETAHYLGVGDSRDEFRKRALKISLDLSTAFQRHFHDKGFQVALPSRRLTVVVLKDRASYEKFLGEDAGPDVGGHFDLDANRLVIYDFRPPPDDPDPIRNAERVNSFTLVHECLHQLTFNTGLLNLQGDVPACISEGLATYGECWRPTGRSIFGQKNGSRLQVLAEPDNLAKAWIPVSKLLTDDRLLSTEDTEQLAYAQSWVLVYYFLKTPAKLPAFRKYLDAIRERKDGAKRLEDATRHLGDLKDLDQELRRYAARLIDERV